MRRTLAHPYYTREPFSPCRLGWSRLPRLPVGGCYGKRQVFKALSKSQGRLSLFRVLFAVLLMLLVIGCTQSQPTAEETLRSEMCDAVVHVYVASAPDHFSEWISDARISFYWDASESELLYPTPGDSSDDWMRGVQIWGWSYHQSTLPIAPSRFVERWGVVNDAATGYLAAICEGGRDALPAYSADTSGCDVWHDEVSVGDINPTRILDVLYQKTFYPEKQPPDVVGFIGLMYGFLGEIARDAIIADNLFEWEIAHEMSLNAAEIASTLCHFDIPAVLVTDERVNWCQRRTRMPKPNERYIAKNGVVSTETAKKLGVKGGVQFEHWIEPG